MSEENKNDEKIKVNVIRKPQSVKKPEAHDGDAEVEKKVIILKKKPTIVVKVKDR